MTCPGSIPLPTFSPIPFRNFRTDGMDSDTTHGQQHLINQDPSQDFPWQPTHDVVRHDPKRISQAAVHLVLDKTEP
ncbi:hypothetical protein CDAR_95241 [Caerostris darwini]|uniref:Uncharacterized protein n=1 Tax=Caerostris darwini TaxID=1538125 RepID=A0AAV4PJ38_9ARAC|nr:hypothetical protein CDAR_95241 [Caerostris darwini]